MKQMKPRKESGLGIPVYYIINNTERFNEHKQALLLAFNLVGDCANVITDNGEFLLLPLSFILARGSEVKCPDCIGGYERNPDAKSETLHITCRRCGGKGTVYEHKI